jgi:hypothetical protein
MFCEKWQKNRRIYVKFSRFPNVYFVISAEHHIFPLEVKSGFSRKKKSLAVYGEKFSKEENSPLVLSRASLRNFALDLVDTRKPRPSGRG